MEIMIKEVVVGERPKVLRDSEIWRRGRREEKIRKWVEGLEGKGWSNSSELRERSRDSYLLMK